jgi:hypothetical protein
VQGGAGLDQALSDLMDAPREVAERAVRPKPCLRIERHMAAMAAVAQAVIARSACRRVSTTFTQNEKRPPARTDGPFAPVRPGSVWIDQKRSVIAPLYDWLDWRLDH